MEPHVIAKLQAWSVTPTAYRQDVGFPFDTVKKDVTWIGACKPSSNVMIRIYEDWVVKKDNDKVLLDLKNGQRSISGALESSGPLGDAITAVTEELANENAGKPQTTDTTPSYSTIRQREDASNDRLSDEDCGGSAETDALSKWKSFADNLYGRYVKLIVEPGDADVLARELSSSLAMQTSGAWLPSRGVLGSLCD